MLALLHAESLVGDVRSTFSLMTMYLRAARGRRGPFESATKF
jgi:hypothetical protein